MNEYELDGSRLVPRESTSGTAEKVDQRWRIEEQKPLGRIAPLSIEQALAGARARLRRVSPDEAYEAIVKTGAILVDIRPEGQRAIEGSIAGVGG